MEEKQQLEEQMRAVMDKFKYKRRQIRELQEDLKVLVSHLITRSNVHQKCFHILSCFEN